MENLPVAILEALAAGLPVLAGPVGGIPEIFTDGTEGRYWDLDDPVGAAASLIDVMESDGQHGDRAYGRFVRQFAPEVIGPRLVSFLSSVP
jgi:glycosyltransferase involved in cell wall biosynthesis